jgi:homogentisate 1,2-dioxygenase
MDRTPILYNEDVAISIVCPKRSDDFFYRNSQGDELIYVSDGQGVLESIFGTLDYRPGDYVVIPRGTIHRFLLGDGESRFLVMESRGCIRTPAHYRNEHGQLLENSPFCERDIRRPQKLPVFNEKGEFPIRVKQRSAIHEVILDHHPFDVVGWDGYYYPWIFNIHDFEPRVGRIHLPPPVHQTFEGDGFVVCSFVPRLFDFHPQAIPAPYNHTNVMSDEVLYYAKGNFMSRKGIEYGSVTFHPDGLPHGPHPGRTEASIGQKSTDELAVMVDTFRPLHVARDILPHEDGKYCLSWLEDE